MPVFSKVLFLFLFLSGQLWAQGPPSIEARLYSEFLVVGERALMSIEIRNARVIDWPDSPKMNSLALTREKKNFVTRNGYIHEVFEYTVGAFQAGTFVIPPFRLKTPDGVIQSKPLTLRVFPVDDLITRGISLKPDVLPYLSGVFLEKESPYLGETLSVEAKLYVPRTAPHLLRLENGQVINMEKDGIAAWRFTTNQRPTGVLAYDGHNFAVYTYRSSINALREGPLQLGPGKAEPIFKRRTTGRGGFPWANEVVEVEFPAKSITVRPLPDDAPEGFAGAVGNFSLGVSSTMREIKMGDTLTIEAKVTGTGNIDQFPGPTLIDPEANWKQFEMIAKPPGSERRTSEGTVEFSQVIRPTKKVSSVPSYQFVFFDPVIERYLSLKTPPQPITITGEALVAGTEAEVALKFLTPTGTKPIAFGSSNTFPIWLWQIIPAGLLAVILGMIFRQRNRGRQLNEKPSREFEAELNKVRDLADDQVAFYREATLFVTTWRGGEDFEELFKKRDEICFLPEKEAEPVPDAEKNRVLNLLKKLSPILLFGMVFLLQSGPLHALDRDPEVAKEEIISAMQSEPSKEHFYNLALCEKALGNSGEAALWAYRFKAQGGDARDILKELPGVRGKDRKGTEWVSYFSKILYFQIILAGAWAFAIFLIGFKLPSGKFRNRLLPISGVTAGLALSIGGVGWFLYPNEVSFEPLHTLSVVTTETPLLSQAFDGGNVMRASLNGSLCKATASRAGFTHIILPGGLAGWVSEESVAKITP